MSKLMTFVVLATASTVTFAQTKPVLTAVSVDEPASLILVAGAVVAFGVSRLLKK